MTKQRVLTTDRNSFFLNKNNPYIELSTVDPDDSIDNNLINNQSDYESGVIVIPSQLIDKALQIDKYSCSIRFICLFDLFTNLFYIFFGYILGIIFGVISLFGYYSTIYHKKSFLFCYLLYQYLQLLAKSVNLSLVITVYSNSDYTNSTYTNMTNNTNSYEYLDKNEFIPTLIVSIIVLLCQIYVTWFIQMYYQLLPTNDERVLMRRNAVI